MTIEQQVTDLTTATTALLAQAAQIAANGQIAETAATTAPATGFSFAIVNGAAVQRITLATLVGLLTPYLGGTVVVTVADLDNTTGAAYTAAIAGASTGSKRMAAANALVAAMPDAHRLVVSRDGAQIILATFTGGLSITNVSGVISVVLGTLVTSTVADGAINTGNWTFQLQGGAGYARTISGTVGPSGSGKDLILSGDTQAGDGIDPNISFLLPASLDGL